MSVSWPQTMVVVPVRPTDRIEHFFETVMSIAGQATLPSDIVVVRVGESPPWWETDPRWPRILHRTRQRTTVHILTEPEATMGEILNRMAAYGREKDIMAMVCVRVGDFLRGINWLVTMYIAIDQRNMYIPKDRQELPLWAVSCPMVYWIEDAPGEPGPYTEYVPPQEGEEVQKGKIRVKWDMAPPMLIIDEVIQHPLPAEDGFVDVQCMNGKNDTHNLIRAGFDAANHYGLYVHRESINHMNGKLLIVIR